jgi:hypothetical protein
MTNAERAIVKEKTLILMCSMNKTNYNANTDHYDTEQTFRLGGGDVGVIFTAKN